MNHKNIPSFAQLKKQILALPKWGWCIIGIFYIVGFILSFTILIWLPGSTIMFIMLGIETVVLIQKRLSK